MIFNSIIGFLWFCSTVGVYALGVKSRGWIPLRVPANKIRLENSETDLKIMLAHAEADVEIAKLAKEKRQAELELEHGDIKGRAMIEEAERGQKQLTQGKNSDLAEDRLAHFIEKHFESSVEVRTLTGLLSYLEEQIVENEKQVFKVENHYRQLMRELARFHPSQMPKYLEKAYTEAQAAIA